MSQIVRKSEASSAVETQVALIQRDLEDIRRSLHGDGKDRKGLLRQVEELVVAADRGRFTIRAVFWLGGGIVAAATAVAQLKEAVVELFRY